MKLRGFLVGISLIMFAQIAAADVNYDKSIWEVSGTDQVSVATSYLYSNSLISPFPTSQVDGFRVVSSCPVDWIEKFSPTHWDGHKHQPVATQQLLSNPRETVYKVQTNGRSIDSFSIRLRWDHPPSDPCHFSFEITKQLVASSGVTSAIEFCGNGIDEDGDGADLACVKGTGSIPTIRTITVYDRGANEGIRVDPQGPIQFPAGADARVRIINKSVWKVNFSGNLTPGWLEGPGDEITSSVGAPGNIKLEIPHENVLVKLERAAPASGESSTPFKGIFTLTNGAILEARVNIVAESAPKCINPNLVDSVRECVGLASCRIKTTTHVVLINPKTSGVVTEYDFSTDQCNQYGDTYQSTLNWNGLANDLNIDGYYTNSFHSETRRLTLTGSPAGLVGRLDNVGGMSGELQVKYSP